MPDIFQCGIHDFSTSDLKEWDKHCAEVEHEYDSHIECTGLCGAKLHIKPNIKLAPEAGRSPKGFVCPDCKKNIDTVSEIKEAGEIANA